MREIHVRKIAIMAITLAGLALPAIPAVAHHSFAMFDADKVVTLKGTVKQFSWTNPHVYIFLDVDGTTWAVELTSPGNLTRVGWTRNVIKPGDKIEVEVNPLRDGKHGGGFRQMTLANGQVMRARLFDLESKPAS
jgi:hypothetical protein